MSNIQRTKVVIEKPSTAEKVQLFTQNYTAPNSDDRQTEDIDNSYLDQQYGHRDVEVIHETAIVRKKKRSDEKVSKSFSDYHLMDHKVMKMKQSNTTGVIRTLPVVNFEELRRYGSSEKYSKTDTFPLTFSKKTIHRLLSLKKDAIPESAEEALIAHNNIIEDCGFDIKDEMQLTRGLPNITVDEVSYFTISIVHLHNLENLKTPNPALVLIHPKNFLIVQYQKST